MTPILVDDRIGSKHLASIIGKQDERAEVELTRLEYGDVAITIQGPDDVPMLVGIEVKRISDLLDSIAKGRLVAHQIPGLLNMYDLCFLLIEGLWKRDSESGVLQVMRGRKWEAGRIGSKRWMWRDIQTLLISIYMQTLFAGSPIGMLQTSSAYETAALILGINSWGSKHWKDHKSLKAINQTNSLSLASVKQRNGTGAGRFMPPNLLEQIAAQFDCIGPTRAIAVAKHFPTLHDMFNADEKEWQSIEGIGKLTSRRVTDAIRGR